MTQRPLTELIEELRNKINLLEGDRKAYYENSYYSMKKNKESITELRKENKELRKQLKDRLSADDHVINQAFQDRPVERAALSNKTGRDAIQSMDYKVSDTKKKLNALKHVTTMKQKRLAELQRENQAMEEDAEEAKATQAGESKEGQRLRDLENRMDKTKMKLKDAEMIKKTYEQIKAKLQEEHLTFGNTLDEMEKEIKDCRNEITQLTKMNEEAQKSKEEAQMKLKKVEETVHAERKRRENEIQELKREADERRHQQEKIERRMAQRELNQDTLGVERSATMGSEDQHQRIESYHEAFRKIKEATGVSDLKEIVSRFESQGQTRERLEDLKRESDSEIRRLTDEKEQLRNKFEDIKYSGEAKLSAGQRLLETYQTQLSNEEARKKETEEDLEKSSKILVQVKAGVEHLYEKLSHVKVQKGQATQAHIDPSSDEYVLDLLGKCEEKLIKLMEELENEDIDQMLQKMHQEEFFAKVENQLPQHNTRIKLPSHTREMTYDDDSESGDDDGEVLSRAAVKKQSQQLIDQKTKKRVSRKKKKPGK